MVNDNYKKQEPYEKLKFYQNICYIRKSIYLLTKPFAKTHPKVVSQARDAARSAKQNIREGYLKDSIGIFINQLKISKGSLNELLGDLEDFFEDKLIKHTDFIKTKILIQKTDYMIDRYIDAVSKLAKQGKWKKRFQ